ncbi:MAG TPA: hypothetical protein VFF06_32075 [Polyangia bacterium]|nr:hypothetical protein [Polyangia bacterium]
MNSRIGKLIRMGLFAGLALGGGAALAQSSPENDTGSSGSMTSPPVVSPSDQDNLQNKKDLDQDINNAPTDNAKDIHRTRGEGDENALPPSGNTEESTTTVKKHKKTIQGRSGTKSRTTIEKKGTKSSTDVDHDMDMQDKSNLEQNPDLTK